MKKELLQRGRSRVDFGGALMVSANDRDDRAARENVIAGKDIGLENEAAQKISLQRKKPKDCRTRNRR